jgi:hypothetical protein
MLNLKYNKSFYDIFKVFFIYGYENGLLHFISTPPYRGHYKLFEPLPGISRLSLTWYPGNNLKNTTHSLEFPGYQLHCTLEIWHNTTPPWNFQVISYIVPWKYGITQPLPGISKPHYSWPLPWNFRYPLSPVCGYKMQ